jgi:hypothetical protein
MKGSQLELAENWNFARDFPKLDEHVVDRPYFLETIVDILTPETPVVFLEGEEGDGATTTLAQYCLKYPDQTFSLFIRAASRFSYSPEYLRLSLAEQFHWYVYGTALVKHAVDPGEFEALVHLVRRKKKSATLYIVVDGLHQIPDLRLAEQILKEVLPIGVDNFRFIISGQQAILGKSVGAVGTKPYQQLKFRPEDTQAYLNGLRLAHADIVEIHKLCKGIPGRIAAVKRLLNGGTALADILEHEPGRYLEFIRLEFKDLDDLTQSQRMALAVIAFAKRPLTAQNVAAIASLSADDLSTVLKKCSFLTSPALGDGIEYRSESHRRIAEKVLADLQKEALALQVAYLLKEPKGEAALRFLPTYYQQLNQLQAIIDLISTEHYTELLQSTQSITALRNRADLGSRSAAQLGALIDVAKFSAQRSVFVSLGSQDALESEVAALVALNQPNKALALASRVMMKEERLSLLATYAKQHKEKHGTVDPELINFIKSLASQIDFTELGDKAVEIAADMLSFDADLAVSIVEEANKRAARSLDTDTAFAQLSIQASLSKMPNRVAVEDKARQRISDSALQKLTSSFATLVETLSPQEVINTVARMDGAAHRIYFLKWYVQFRKDQEHILDVIEYALDAIVRETTYTPTSRDFAELAIALPYVTKDRERVEKLIQRFENQVGLVARATFSKDIIVLQMRIAQAEMAYDRNRATARIEQAYFDVATIKTPEVQSECYAIMLRMLRAIDKDGELEKDQGFRTVIRADLSSVLENILAHTADHYAATDGALKALAMDDCKAALDLAAKLNIQTRREEAYRLVARTIAAQPYSDVRDTVLSECINRIKNSNLRSDTVADVFKAFEANKLKQSWLNTADRLLPTVDIPELRCLTLISRLKLASSVPAELLQTFEIDFLTSIEKVDSKLTVIDLCFKAADALGKIDHDAAVRMYDKGSTIREKANPATPGALHLLRLCVSLTARALKPVIKAGLFSDSHYLRFTTLVDQIPCFFSRMDVYADLAARAWSVKRFELCGRIVREKCYPMIEEAELLNPQLARRLIKICFPTARCAHGPSAYAYLKRLEQEDADDALYEAALLVLRKLPPNDPCLNNDYEKCRLETEDGYDLVQILEHTDSDSGFYWTLEAIIQAMTSKTNKLVFTAQQRADYARRIHALIDNKLPDSRNITHDGYKIAARAQVYRLEDVVFAHWVQLEKNAKQIGNTADQGYVLVALSNCMPAKYDSHKKRLLEEALKLFDKIPSPIDRLSHYQNYASAASKDALASAKETLKRALLLSSEIEGNARVERHRRELIDIADRIDPALAEKLIEQIDDDPARAHAKSELKRSAAVVKTKREIANAKAIKDVSSCDRTLFPAAAWKNVAALLAGRLETKSNDVMSEYVQVSCASGLNSSYPMLAWFIENAACKFTQQAEASENLVPLVEGLLDTVETTLAILSVAASQKTLAVDFPSDDTTGLMVTPRDRAHALQFIREWLRANAVDYIKFSDPYFGPSDVQFLRMILAECPDCKVYILTSRKELKKHNALDAESFLGAWSTLIDQDPPDTEILAIGSDGDEKALIHDRWIISKGGGLRIGTSFNSIGEGKLSEISMMEPSKASQCEHHINQFLDRQRVVSGQKVTYLGFTL